MGSRTVSAYGYRENNRGRSVRSNDVEVTLSGYMPSTKDRYIDIVIDGKKVTAVISPENFAKLMSVADEPFLSPRVTTTRDELRRERIAETNRAIKRGY
jgi:hypothetical protein